MIAEFVARLEGRVRAQLVRALRPSLAVRLYSKGRKGFLRRLVEERPPYYVPPVELETRCWGLTFRSPIFNASGIFKNGEGYELVARQGAGAYLAGTTTAHPRQGNERLGVALPFAPYPQSGSSSNWLGLPNIGDAEVASRLSKIQRVPGVPIGVSIMGDPELSGQEKLSQLVLGMRRYQQAGVDFIELNESCPNTAEGRPRHSELKERIAFVSQNFLVSNRGGGAKEVPVVLKFSNDVDHTQIPYLLELIIELGFHGVNFGNTSTAYARHRAAVHPAELPLFDYFTSSFGGGIGGRALKRCSVELVSASAKFLREHRPPREFHIIRTGGVETAQDVLDSLQAGASLVQWFSGYFEAFSRWGHGLQRQLDHELLALMRSEEIKTVRDMALPGR